MAISLYDLTVPNYLQIVGGIEGILDKAAVHFKDKGIDLSEVIEARLSADMLPFKFQVQSVAHHSLGAIRGVQAGQFSPGGPAADTYAGLQKLVTEARDALQKLTPADVNALEGKDVSFQCKEFKLPFTAENFLQSFSFPNFYFHATTAYDILRHKGVPLGKRDFMGRMRMKS